MQVDPIKPALKAVGTKRLKLNYDGPLSKIAFNFNLRRFNKAPAAFGLCTYLLNTGWAGAYTRPPHSSP